ncbi:MAG: hypothetical protein ACI4IE_04320 [Eubacterium sp.]
MTSKKYSVDKRTASYDLKQSYKSIIVPAVISLVVMSENFLYNIWELTNSMSDDGTLYGIAAAKNMYAYYLTSNMNESIGLSCCVVGILFALFSFSYIMRKKKVNVFFSMPIDRAAMYKNRVLASVSLMAGTILVPLIVDVIVNVHLFGNARFMLIMGFWLFAESMVYMLTSFAFMSVALALCYTMLEGVLFGLSLMGFPYILTVLCDQFNSAFLDGYSRTSSLDSMYLYSYGEYYFHRPLYLETTIVNPFMFGVPAGSNTPANDIYSICYSEKGFAYPGFKYILPIIVWAIISIALIFLAKRLFINRKAEKTGIFSSNKPAIVFISVSASLLVAAYSAYILIDTLSKPVTAVISVVMALLCSLVISAILNKKIVLPKHSYATAAVVTVFTAVFSAVLIGGGFGYSSYVPEYDKVEAAYISNNIVDDKFALTNSYPSYYNGIPESDSFLDNDFGVFEGEDDLKIFTETAKKIVKNDSTDDKNMIYVVYRLKNGKNVYRYYKNVSADVNYSVLSLTQTESYKNELKSNLLPEKYGKSTFRDKVKKYGFSTATQNTEYDIPSDSLADGQFYIGYYSTGDDTKVPSNTPELREALLKDLLNTKPDQYFKSDEKSLCSIGFTSYNEIENEKAFVEEIYDDTDAYTGYGYDYTYRVYPYMTNTVNYLKSVGALKDKDIEISKNSLKSVYCISRKDVLKDKKYYSMFVYNSIFDNFTSFWSQDDDYGFYDDTTYYDENSLIQNSNNQIDFSKFTAVTDAEAISTIYSKAVDFRYCDNSEWYVIFEYDTNDINKRYLPMMVTDENMPDSVKSAKPSADKSNKSV